MINTNLQTLGEELYHIYRIDHTQDYPISRKFIDNLTEEDKDRLISSFIEERKKYVDDVGENDHIEAFWVMYDECE